MEKTLISQENLIALFLSNRNIEIKTLKYLHIPHPDTLMDGQDAEPLPVRPLVEWSDVQSTSAWLGQPAECLYKWVSAESAGWTAQRKRRGILALALHSY